MSSPPPPSRPLRAATVLAPAYPDLRMLRRLLAGAVPLLTGGPALADATVPVPAATVSSAGAAVSTAVREPVHLDGEPPSPRAPPPWVEGRAPAAVHLKGKLVMPRPPLPGGPPAPRPSTVGDAPGSPAAPGKLAPGIAPRPVPPLPGQAPAASPKPAPVAAPPRQALRLHFHEPWEPCLTVVLDDEAGEAIG